LTYSLYLACWFIWTLFKSGLKVKIVGQRSRLHELNMRSVRLQTTERGPSGELNIR